MNMTNTIIFIFMSSVRLLTDSSFGHTFSDLMYFAGGQRVRQASVKRCYKYSFFLNYELHPWNKLIRSYLVDVTNDGDDDTIDAIYTIDTIDTIDIGNSSDMTPNHGKCPTSSPTYRP